MPAEVASQRSLTYFRLEYIYFVIAVISIVLVIWQYFGMNKVLQVFPNPDVQAFAKSDDINGGYSESHLLKNAKGIQLHCETKPSETWPFCNLELNWGNNNRGINLTKFDHLLLWLDHKSTVQDTMLVYLINSEENAYIDKRENAGREINYVEKSNMITILPASKQSFYSLPLDKFTVPSWWILHHNALGRVAESRIDNVIKLSIATGDNDKLRSVDIILKKALFTGKWVTADTLYLLIIIVWMILISTHAFYYLYRLAKQLKVKRIEHKKLQEINSLLSIQKNKLEVLVRKDHLTGLYNRAGTLELLQNIQDKTDIEYSLIMFDIDHFKNINDSYGHEMGDVILKSLATKVKSYLRDTDHIARWGGEEFIIICPNTNLDTALYVAELVRERIATTRLTEKLSITCSFGVTQFDHGAIKPAFRAVDAAMYVAKNRGRNRVEIGQPES